MTEKIEGLYQLYVVNKSTQEVISDLRIIASDEMDAIDKAGILNSLKSLNLKSSDVAIYGRAIGFPILEFLKKVEKKSGSP